MSKKQHPESKPANYEHQTILPVDINAEMKKSYIEYLLDILLYDTPEEKKALVAEQRKEVMKLEQRIAGHTAEHDRGRSQRKSGLDR